MTPRDFCYWLRGMMEANGDSVPSREQWENVVSHLKLVMEEKEKPFGWPSSLPSDSAKDIVWPPFTQEEFDSALTEMKAEQATTISCCPPPSCRGTLIC